MDAIQKDIERLKLLGLYECRCKTFMKDYSCSYGHRFNKEDVKEGTNIGSGAVCPLCWPNGFMKDCERRYPEDPSDLQI